MDAFRSAVLIVATVTMGLMAGVFGLYANAIMPGLRKTDDRTFVSSVSVDRQSNHQPVVHVDVFRRVAPPGPRGGASPSGRGAFGIAVERGRVRPLSVCVCLDYRGQRAAQRRDQSGRRSRHHRCRRGACAFQRGEVAPLERRTHRDVHRWIRLSRACALGAREQLLIQCTHRGLVPYLGRRDEQRVAPRVHPRCAHARG